MSITVKDLSAAAMILAGTAGLDRRIASPQIMAPDLAARAFGKDAASGIMHIRPGQAAYLDSLRRDERLRLVREVLKQKPACILFTGGSICGELLEKAESAKIPVLKSRNLRALRRLLTERLRPSASLHGVLVQVFGLGTLVIGESAVGKSEAALDLVLRGHKLAADDLVLIARRADDIIGRAADLGRELLQIRGLGIINIRAIYGETSVIESCLIGLVVELEEWQKGHQYSLVGLRERRYRLLGVNLPYLKLPVKPGRNMATLIEVAVRNQMLKNRGVFTARELNKKIRKRLST